MYLACGTRPDIAFIIGLLIRHNADPRKIHLREAKRVVQYLKGTMQLGFIYGRASDGRSPTLPPPYGIIGYADSNFAGDPEDQKSVMGNCFFFNGAVVLWSSNKQRTVSTSITEAEYITLGHEAREAVWIHRFIDEMTLDIVPEITLNGDNEMSITLTKNAESQNRTKHTYVQHHYIREPIDEKEVTIVWVSSAEISADGMTKALPTETFRRYQAQLGLRWGFIIQRIRKKLARGTQGWTKSVAATKGTTGYKSAWKRSGDKECSGHGEYSRHKERMVIKADTESTEDTKSAWSSRRDHSEARSSRSLRRGHQKSAIEKRPSRKTIEKRRGHREAAIEKQSQRPLSICHRASGAAAIKQRPSSSGHQVVAINRGHRRAAIEKRPSRKTIEKRRGHREAAIKKQGQRPWGICHRASRAAAI